MSKMTDQQGIRSSNWYRAVTLAERVASLRAAERAANGEAVDSALATRRLGHWRLQPPFDQDASFRQRLAADGIDEAEFLQLLGEPAESVQKRFSEPPSWLEELGNIFSTLPLPGPLPLPSPAAGTSAAFLEAVEPLIRRGRDRLREGVNALVQSRAELPFNPETIDQVLYANLPVQLLLRLSRTFVLELAIARMEGSLNGSTPEDRFQSFVERLRQPWAILALLEQYPVLARQLMTCVDQWVTFGLAFLQHLVSDWEALRASLKIETSPGVLVEATAGGDRHRGGRSVLLLKFSSGFRLVYKPRSLAADTHFQQLLDWLNQHGNHPPFRTLKVVDRGSHGWMEFVDAESCKSADQVHRFYRRIGGYLALLYTLEATDFHSENLVAAGEDPVLLDLETVFGPRFQAGQAAEGQADLLAADLIQSSVLRVMLLPQRLWNVGDSGGVDLSGVASTAGQLTPFAVPQWQREATDEMRLIRKRVAMSGDKNTPTLNGNDVPVLEYVDAIADGFTGIYHLIEEHRDALTSASGPLAAFADDEVRVILRPTQTYGTLLMESYHPDALRNALDRDRLFDRLWIYVEHFPYLSRAIAHERADMHRGDVPMFTTRPNSRDLWSHANPPIRNILAESGMTGVQRRIQGLGTTDLAKQLWFIRASFATMPGAAGRSRQVTHHPVGQNTVIDRVRLVAAARAVGDRLDALAVRGGDDVTWIGLNYMNEGNAAVKPLDRDLYDGIPGVALFLAYLGAMTGEERYTSLAQRAVTNLCRAAGDNQAGNGLTPLIGAFCGWGGLIYTLTHLSSLWTKPALIDEAQALVDLLPALIDQDQELDIIGGAAGCIGALLALYRAAASDRTLAMAIRCGDHLRDRVQSNKRQKLLTGFSHGAAGMAWALLELASVAGEERFRRTALELIEWERSLFNSEEKNWPDLRDRHPTGLPAENDVPAFRFSWCHGAPGIGLARLRSLPHLDDAQVRREINVALETALAKGFGRNHSLCHGDLGNLEFVVYASQWLDPGWQVEVKRLTGMILDDIRLQGWLCGVPLEVETPGLMTGLAGIGYQFLRLADPLRVPSVLTLEGPVPGDGKPLSASS